MNKAKIANTFSPLTSIKYIGISVYFSGIFGAFYDLFDINPKRSKVSTAEKFIQAAAAAAAAGIRAIANVCVAKVLKCD